MSEPAPAKLGKYEILRELGRGAMGVVYEAFDPSIERVVALKTIRRDQLDGAEAEEMLVRFQREARAAGRLNHPNIVSIYDFGDDNGTSFIAMEFVRGRELKSYFEKNERFALPEIVRIMGQLLDALEYSHNYGVVHRDVKPANIIILADGQVKVADFGIARIESSQFTQAGTVLGTPAYMSPEQFMGQTVDRRSDVFSAGIVLYQFLTGERPFSGAATTIMHKVLSVDPPPPSLLNVQAPRPFDAVIGKAMAKRPEDRFQTAREFADAIRLAAEGKAAPGLPAAAAGADATLVNPASDATVKAVADRTATLSPPSAIAPAAAPAPRRKSPALAVAAVVVVIIGAGIASYFILPRSPASAPAVATPTPSPAAAPASAPAPASVAAAPAGAPAPAPVAAVQAEPGTMIISAVGLADPSDQKYQADKSLLAADLRADSKSQLVEKAIALYLDRASLAKNYDVLRDKLLSKSGSYIANIVQEGEPRLGKDGLMSVTTQATVKVREVQKSLNQMSRDERIDFIRNNGDPGISVAISVRGEGDAPAQNSQIAENLLKERIKSFGFRIWSDDPKTAPAAAKSADFSVIGEAKLKKLSARLEASGITIDKYMLTSWTVKCIDKQTGEEIYHNNKLPVGAGSWATPEQALAAIGGKIADEFSRDFFVRHFNPTGQKVTLRIAGLQDKAAEEAITRELVGLQPVISAARRAGEGPPTYDLRLSGSTGPLNDLVASVILKPLNAKLGQSCFNLGAMTGEQVAINFDPACSDKAVLARLDTNPPASLYAAPPARQKSVLKDPAAIKKLTI
jgi:serine/threonine-protein kinase